MDRLRELMETAIEAHWRESVPPEPIADGDGAARSPSSVDVAGRMPTPLGSRPRKTSRQRVAAPAEASASSIRTVRVDAATLERNRLVAALPRCAEREAFCLLQAAIGQRLGPAPAIVGVTGPRSGRGKTLTAVNLGISLSLDGHRNVVIVDLDFQSPTVQTLFGVEVTGAVQDCLFNGAAWWKASFSPSIERFTVLPARAGSASPKQILRSATLKALLDSLRTEIPDAVTILDLPAVAGRGEGAVLESLVDAVLLVVEDGATREADYRRTLESFSRQKLLGTILNRIETPE